MIPGRCMLLERAARSTRPTSFMNSSSTDPRHCGLILGVRSTLQASIEHFPSNIPSQSCKFVAVASAFVYTMLTFNIWDGATIASL
jgi:hypothetical protein